MKQIKNLLKEVVRKKEPSSAPHYKYVHIVNNDKFSAPYAHFINRKFEPSEHLFLFFGGHPPEDFPIPSASNIRYLSSAWQFFSFESNLSKAHKIFMHGIFTPSLLYYCLYRSRILKKAYWVIWGGDLYGDRNRRRISLQGNVKRHFVHRLRGLVVLAKGDYDIARSVYGFKQKECHKGYYINPLSLEILKPHQNLKSREKKPLVIQINNSADISTLEILKHLERFRAENIRIFTILSYGDHRCADQIKEYGKAIFQEKFTPITDYLAPEEYAKQISQTDILIMNQKRQQGLGNIYALLYLGAKVYLRSDVSSWHDIHGNFDVQLEDTLNLPKHDFETLSLFSTKTTTQNAESISQVFHDDYLKQTWEAIFTGNSPTEIH